MRFHCFSFLVLGVAIASVGCSSGFDKGGLFAEPPPETAVGKEAGAPVVVSHPEDSGALKTPQTRDSGPMPTMPTAQDAAAKAVEAGTADTGARIGTSVDAGTDSGPPVWTNVSVGVYGTTLGTGHNIVIAYGGYSATAEDSEAWATALVAARLGALGVGQVYAVQGPEDPDYSQREIGNSELAAALLPEVASASYVIVIAHSSGGFVADELFTFADPSVMAKIAYFNLDGGSWALTNDMVGTMLGVYFCGAYDSVAGYSENYQSDEDLNDEFPQSHLFTVDADGSGCDVGAGWCVHDTLITNQPHDPTTYDLALDYTDFTGGRHVVTTYIDQAVSDSVL